MGEASQPLIRALLLERGYLGEAFLRNVESDAIELGHAAKQAVAKTPKQYQSLSARKLAADVLRTLCAHHGVKFTAYASVHGAMSPAVEYLVQAARSAGDDLTPEDARKLIQAAKKENRETVTRKSD